MSLLVDWVYFVGTKFLVVGFAALLLYVATLFVAIWGAPITRRIKIAIFILLFINAWVAISVLWAMGIFTIPTMTYGPPMENSSPPDTRQYPVRPFDPEDCNPGGKPAIPPGVRIYPLIPTSSPCWATTSPENRVPK